MVAIGCSNEGDMAIRRGRLEDRDGRVVLGVGLVLSIKLWELELGPLPVQLVGQRVKPQHYHHHLELKTRRKSRRIS